LPADPQLSVGGQAVIEGVMMRAPSGWAVAVRKPDGLIEAVRHDLPRLSSRSRAAKIPLVRGVMVLGESLSLGYRALTWSAQKSVGDEEEPISRREMAISITMALLLFVGLFIVAPAWLAGWAVGDSELAFAAVESVIRLVVFVGYLWLLGRSEELKRVFRYHGAEHMTIHAYEAGDELAIESISRHRPEHPRCGTSFLMLVMLIAIVLFTFLGKPDWPLLVASRIIGIPVVAGISYEALKWSGGHRSTLFGKVLAAPGMWLQRLTTAVPDDAMIEVAVASLLAAVDSSEGDRLVATGALPAPAIAARPVASEA
jgi:uncharacterized protein YqhQ